MQFKCRSCEKGPQASKVLMYTPRKHPPPSNDALAPRDKILRFFFRTGKYGSPAESCQGEFQEQSHWCGFLTAPSCRGTEAPMGHSSSVIRPWDGCLPPGVAQWGSLLFFSILMGQFLKYFGTSLHSSENERSFLSGCFSHSKRMRGGKQDGN